ncbi:MAG: CHRD domain-containing protein [Thiotrichales bacterium]|nr:MAG: CHRD domain-containing protein [Thiotrichales bacterium]
MTTNAAVINLKADIDGAQANAGAGTGSSGTGLGLMEFDDVTKILSWNISWSGLTGTETVAHFHGPGAPGVNAPAIVTIDHTMNPSTGSSSPLTTGQESDLLSGLWYINIHSTFAPGGEIRGQVEVVPIPAAAWLFGSGLLLLAGIIRRRI